MGAREVELILERIETLPTLAPIATRLLQASAADDFRVEEVTQLIESDPTLTARILRLCSRAETGLGDRVTTVRRAVVMLGIEAVRAAVLAVCVFDLMDGLAGQRRERHGAAPQSPNEPGFDRAGFWQHAIGVACASEMLARGRPDVKPEDAFVAGLLHDLGKLALFLALPQTFEAAVGASARTGAALGPVLRRVMGVDHHEAGRRLARHWGLPEAFGECMWLHGQPESAVPDGPARGLTLVVSMAKAICRVMHLGWSGEGDLPRNIESAGALFAMDVRRAEEVSASIHERTAARCAALGLGEKSSPELLLRSLVRANEGLVRAHARLARRAAEAPAPQASDGAAEAVGRFLESCPTAAGLASVARAIAQAAEGTLLVGVLRAGRDDVEVVAGIPGDDAPRLLIAPAAASLVNKRIDAGDALGAAGPLASEAGLTPDSGWSAVVLAGSPGESRVLVAGSSPALNNARDPRLAAWSAAVRAAAQYERAEGLAQGLVVANRAVVEAQSRLSEAESMARLGEMTSGAAHEMNNPLTIICGRAQLLAAALKAGPEAEAARAIAQASRELSDLVTNLNALAAPGEVRREPIDVAAMLREAAVAAAESLHGADGRGGQAGRVRCTCEPGTPARLTGDRALLARAIGELIRNAWEAGSEASVVARAGARGLEIEIRDQGPGFSAKALRHAFDPFFSERAAGRGRGLGLARCRRIVRLHGGEVTLANAPGGGAAVCVTLPAEEISGVRSRAA